MRVRRRGPWTEAELNSAVLPCHLICFFPDCLSRSLAVWVVLADLHWDIAMILIALICQWTPAVVGVHSNITPKHGVGAMWILLSFHWWLTYLSCWEGGYRPTFTHSKHFSNSGFSLEQQDAKSVSFEALNLRECHNSISVFGVSVWIKTSLIQKQFLINLIE